MGAVGAILGAVGVLVAAVISVIAGLFYAVALLLIHRNYKRSFLHRALNMIKTLFATGQFILIPPEEDIQQPVLNYALPIGLGTFFTLYLKISESNFIQELLGLQFCI